MAGFVFIILSVANGAVADAFQFQSGSRVLAPGDELSHMNHRALPPFILSKQLCHSSEHRLSLSKFDSDSELAVEIESMDTDLAREIEEALYLAQDALATEVEALQDEENIDEIADMLMKKPPAPAPPLPLPPKEDPLGSIISLALEEDDDGGELLALAPESPRTETEADLDLGDQIKKKATEEFEKMKNLIFGLKDELAKTIAITEEAEGVASLLKEEIEKNLQEREAMVKLIESEVAAEKELLVVEMEKASNELQLVMDQSAQNITKAKSKAAYEEKELMAHIKSLQAAIGEVTAEFAGININKEKIERSKQLLLDQVIQEGQDRLAQVQKSIQFDTDYAAKMNAQLVHRAEEVERKVRSVYDQIDHMRTDEVTLQQQILDVENAALEEIASLEHEMRQADERYSGILQKERARMGNIIDAAYQAYAVKICKKIVKREAAEAEYQEKIRKVRIKIENAKEKQEARVIDYLEVLEKKHKKERIAIYQEKVEAVSAVRKQMNTELAVDYAKIKLTHKTMRGKIDAVRKQRAEMKAEFEKEMSMKRQLAKAEEDELLSEIEDVRKDMMNKIKSQRSLYEGRKASYLEDMNGKIVDSELKLRRKWRQLAGVKQLYDEVRGKRHSMIDDVTEQQALIESYESDRKSFRESLRLAARAARKKIGSKTRSLLGKVKVKKTP